MCGIVAIIHEPGRFYAVDEMLNKIRHRGKDQLEYRHYPTCDVGFVRLAITDLEERQPQGKDWVVFLNGEIYNYKELGFEGSETSIISQGLQKYGLDFVKKLNGMFVILAIHGNDVYVFRDRYGIKPIYYYKDGDKTVIASEIKAFLNYPGFKVEINESAERQWMVFNNVLTDETLFKGVHKLEKGTIWHVNSDTKTKFWQWKFTPKPTNYRLAKSHVRHLIEKAILRQIPHSVNYGTCLSGGVDSNIITALCGDVPTFTAGFTEGQDERHLAELAGKKHYEVVFNQVRDLDKTIYHLEDLRVGASWSNYGLCELASKFVKVLFDGAGADELFGGYSWRYTHPDYYSVVNRTGIKDQYCRDLFDQMFTDTLENRFAFDAEHFLEGVLLVGDKMSMAHTIEMRVPFLDNDLVDYALTLPNEYKENKKILKDACADLLPEPILNGIKKGFSSPDWFGGSDNKALNWAKTALNEWRNIYGKH
jgi:asparagine synthase (glutamine-hydrolysing)